MATVNDLIKGSLRIIGVYSSLETPSAADISDGLSAMRAMLSSWSTEGLSVYKYTREVFQLTGGKSQYTIGDGGDFDTIRPVKITQATASDANVVELTPFIPGDPLALPDPIPDTPATYETRSVIEFPVAILNIQQWASVQLKPLQSDYVQAIYVEGDSPLDRINVWPVPSSAKAIVLYSQKPLTDFDSVATDFLFPPGYEEAIKYNLALRLAPEYGKEPKQSVIEIARDSKANIKRQNTQPVYMKSDALGVTSKQGFNIYTGEYDL